MKYDSPFEIIKKINPISYQLKMPASYGIHPVLNIAHLDKYQTSPFGLWLNVGRKDKMGSKFNSTLPISNDIQKN